ncbi:hypothetical protein Ahy_B05g077552 isoform B [Arachis hypogaea]|uniref:Uncharacterized protein n=1 Tax=Arachis hypogaea TaxID=3818 RepID=A0A444Z5G8_ARAHY|nr:hypothetical protein Ahy_B05g077552 isoform B [Arachis hypogaea]
MTRREHREHQELKEIEILSPSFFPQLVTLVSHCHRRPKLLDAVASSSFLFCKTQKAQHIVFIFVGFSVRRRLVCTEDRFFHRKQNGVKSYCSLVLRMWIIVQNPPPLPNESNAKPHIDLLLKTSEDDLKIWPHSFEFRLRVSLAAEGYLSLACEGLKPFCAIYSSFMQRAYDQNLFKGLSFIELGLLAEFY